MVVLVVVTFLLMTSVQSFSIIGESSTNPYLLHYTSQSETPLTPASRRTALHMAGGNVDKGFNLLEIATKVVPQGRIVQTTKESWKFIWKVS